MFRYIKSCGIFLLPKFLSFYWLVVEPTHLKNISQIASFPQVGMKITNMEPENEALEEEISLKKTSFSASMLVFGGGILLYPAQKNV